MSIWKNCSCFAQNFLINKQSLEFKTVTATNCGSLFLKDSIVNGVYSTLKSAKTLLQKFMVTQGNFHFLTTSSLENNEPYTFHLRNVSDTVQKVKRIFISIRFKIWVRNKFWDEFLSRIWKQKIEPNDAFTYHVLPFR